jgi:hypothetical protein
MFDLTPSHLQVQQCCIKADRTKRGRSSVAHPTGSSYPQARRADAKRCHPFHFGFAGLRSAKLSANGMSVRPEMR